MTRAEALTTSVGALLNDADSLRSRALHLTTKARRLEGRAVDTQAQNRKANDESKDSKHCGKLFKRRIAQVPRGTRECKASGNESASGSGTTATRLQSYRDELFVLVTAPLFLGKRDLPPRTQVCQAVTNLLGKFPELG